MIRHVLVHFLILRLLCLIMDFHSTRDYDALPERWWTSIVTRFAYYPGKVNIVRCVITFAYASLIKEQGATIGLQKSVRKCKALHYHTFKIQCSLFPFRYVISVKFQFNKLRDFDSTIIFCKAQNISKINFIKLNTYKILNTFKTYLYIIWKFLISDIFQQGYNSFCESRICHLWI